MGKVIGKYTVCSSPVCFTDAYHTHCLHITNGDNPNRGIVPSYIVCFSILDAHRTRGCPFMAYRIRMDGTAQRQVKIMSDILVRCKRIYPLFKRR
nr:MAG TPA: hypothetical protein [Caudoviricetes sp.]